MTKTLKVDNTNNIAVSYKSAIRNIQRFMICL